MTQARLAPYGSWKSPITSDLIVKESIGLSQVTLDGGDIYWIEMRPSEGGRQVIVRRTADGDNVDVTPPGLNVRTRVHEYGGGGLFGHNRAGSFFQFFGQQLYPQADGAAPKNLPTPPRPGARAPCPPSAHA